jgi:hypothetical protein
MDAFATIGLLPSTMMLAVAGGTVVVAVLGLLLQKAARTHLQEQRCEQLRERVTRGEAQWHEAAM